MAENYSLNSRFGLNVSQKAQTNQKQLNGEISSNIGDLFDTFDKNESKYDKVLDGSVEKQINMYSRQAMFVGMNLRNSDVRRKFDMNI